VRRFKKPGLSFIFVIFQFKTVRKLVALLISFCQIHPFPTAVLIANALEYVTIETLGFSNEFLISYSFHLKT
jgi:hypothetical protein